MFQQIPMDDLTREITLTTLPLASQASGAAEKPNDNQRVALVAYLRGDFEQVKAIYFRSRDDAAQRVCLSSVSIAAAISLGDYRFYKVIEDDLRKIIAMSVDKSLIGVCELVLSTATVSVFAPNMVPTWLVEGQFDFLPVVVRQDALYHRAKYFQMVEDFAAMKLLAQTGLGIFHRADDVTFHAIYFRILCAIAAVRQNETKEAQRWLTAALNLAVPYGFITPFAESRTAFGGLLEPLVTVRCPAWLPQLQQQWNNTFKNWIDFHNRFTSANLPKMLTAQQYEIAYLVGHGISYVEIGRRMHLAPGTVKNKFDQICQQLQIFGRDRREVLSQYIL